MTGGPGPVWINRRELQRHFAKHHRKLGLRRVDDYESSSLDTIRVGIRFEYVELTTGEWRWGYYDQPTRRFTAVTYDETEIVTHFPESEDRIRRLPASTYPY